ncbi:hypothetical protein [Erythrobacter litoralis]|uniref:Pili assembly chaperone N-terminal domain-containing protein n=1 Tax=Erythrobacter litoralis (strain HTCC2594) TaxID=314225 RepID=Q2N876_ERYLH|nr:hypothetical protein [Erythrobacter litoralis]ABC64115.1 hypothetical protein ELI_10115 [Erythrobacter litoralis HTCC2594]
MRLSINDFMRLASAAALCLATPATAQSAPAEKPSQPEPPEGSVGGLGDVNLFPKRIVIEGRRQIAQIGLYNKTVNEGDYEIKFIDMAMSPEGNLVQFENGATAEQKAAVSTASQFLRYSPRRVALRGGESQLIRVMARAPADIPDGEYRSHFLVTSVPDVSGGLSIEDAVTGQAADGIGVVIRPRFGISIPVIVRIGQTTLDVGMTNPALLVDAQGNQAIGITLTRSGTRSAFGDIVVEASGRSEPVALLRGIGIYPEVDQRKVVIPVEPGEDGPVITPGMQLRVTYVDDDFEPGAELAELTFTVQ